jgi:hypothetical protein
MHFTRLLFGLSLQRDRPVTYVSIHFSALAIHDQEYHSFFVASVPKLVATVRLSSIIPLSHR